MKNRVLHLLIIEMAKFLGIQETSEDLLVTKVMVKLAENADETKVLKSQLAQIAAERDAAMKDILHKCWSCANGFYTDTGFDCDQASYKSGAADCQSWQWRGAKKED